MRPRETELLACSHTASSIVSEEPRFKLNSVLWALPGVAQWIEHQTANLKVAGLIPSQVQSQAEGTQEATNRCFPPSLSLLSLLSKNK